jgi:hypothetical protein
MALFREGLSSRVREHLTLFCGCTFNELVSDSIEQEYASRAQMEEEKRKRPFLGSSRGVPPKSCLVYTQPVGQPRGPPLP